ncbi:SDR family NAD(P)-dependent oxidoreductase [Nonomuraea sp. NN258]|uniref:SDR family NAD(P)-dependent oxidoreductase n=1 Tax=Nonomuraea antri TaxID=2730852 RepID=UPI00156A4FAF|nr:SDR family NAD(P)-dependent oxidoreductase [Nonomuraea antri]NRQ38208.1 SDR family NAD(P)-dependent oxidoreductase [Nonomuraea antri]
MARTIVITGGTNGIGKALARHYTGLGDQVVAVGSSEEGGRRLREEVPKARFVRADLSSLRQTRDLMERLSTEHPVIDALVLAAFRFNAARVETDEGFEHTFALYVINRWLMAEGLRDSLENAPAPVIINLCGAGQGGKIHWDDLQLKGRYRGLTATMQGAAASELLGTAYSSERTKYVLYNPVFVATGLHEPFKQPLRGLVRVASAVFAQPVAKAVPPLAALIDQPPAKPLTIWKRGKPIDRAVDRNEARRFEETVRAATQSALP